MKTERIQTDQTLRELTNHGSGDFPFQCYHNVFSPYWGHAIEWHWHEELEFLYILRGHVTVYIKNSTVDLEEGEGILINSRVIHRFSSPDQASIRNILLRADFIAPAGSPIYEKYVLPAVQSMAASIPLRRETGWQREILQHLARIDSGENELLIHHSLEEIWLLLLEQLPEAKYQPENSAQSRVRRMMEHIADHYSGHLSLEDIAAAASISKSEALRCFRQCLNTTPVGYLIAYRLHRAAAALRRGEENITRVAYDCGFENVSYFCKMFRRQFGLPPKAYGRGTHT